MRVVQSWVSSLLAVGVETIKGAKAILNRQYKTVAALLCLLLPTLAHAQTEHGGGGEAKSAFVSSGSIATRIFDWRAV